MRLVIRLVILELTLAAILSVQQGGLIWQPRSMYSN